MGRSVSSMISTLIQARLHLDTSDQREHTRSWTEQVHIAWEGLRLMARRIWVKLSAGSLLLDLKDWTDFSKLTTFTNSSSSSTWNCYRAPLQFQISVGLEMFASKNSGWKFLGWWSHFRKKHHNIIWIDDVADPLRDSEASPRSARSPRGSVVPCCGLDDRLPL